MRNQPDFGRRPGFRPLVPVIPVLFVLLTIGCSGAPPDYDLAPPASIGSLTRNWVVQGNDAREQIDRLHPGMKAPDPSWAAAYGSNDRIVIYASKFATPAAASAALDAMKTALASGTGGFKAPHALTVAQQPGFRTNDGNTDHFFFVKGAWIVWIQGIARDFDPALASLDWQKS